MSKSGGNIEWNFSDSVVLVTGGAQGMGETYALEFGAAGAAVVICDLERQSEKLDRVAAEVEARGGQALPLVCDICDEDQVDAMVTAAVERFGKLDILINNAGSESFSLVTEMEVADWDRIIAVNLKGMFICSKYATRQMVAAGSGRIITIGSVASTAGIPGNAHYCAAKHGVAGFSKALAVEVAEHGVTVNYVCPTGVDTPMSAEVEVDSIWVQKMTEASGSWNLFEPGTPIDPAEVSAAVMWLASDRAGRVTGSAVYVDAGFTAK